MSLSSCDDFQKLRFNMLIGQSLTEAEVAELEEHYAVCPQQRESFTRGLNRLLEDTTVGD